MTVALAVACAEPPIADVAVTTMPGISPTLSEVSSSTTPPGSSDILLCDETGYPTAPDDWYRDTPIYVGNEMPVEEVQAYAGDLAGYENIWIDRDHHGWVTVGFVGGDVVTYQEMLESEFPGVGVVAVEMVHTSAELNQISSQLEGRLPEGMEVWGTYEARGVVEVFVGLLTPDRIAAAREAIGEDPACLTGQDPATTPLPGPQPEGGDGWDYLGETDFTFAEHPLVITEQAALVEMWEQTELAAGPPDIDFTVQIVVTSFVVHSGSCPVTRLDDVAFETDLIRAQIVHISDGRGCTDDGVPRTYFIALDRDRLPAPPFRIAGEGRQEAMVTVDLRDPGSVATPDDLTPFSPERPRVAEVPGYVEPGFPWPATFDLSCGTAHLGVINGVGWHRPDGRDDLPPEWVEATVDGLLDVELVMTEGPEPTLTVTAGGVNVSYLPGDEPETPCG
ncbi:MAG: hypothetical protein ACRDZM_05930 [Acidimicrobiia bacterium]